MLGQRPFDEGKLLGMGPRPRHRRFRLGHHAEQLRVQHQKEHVLVDEAVVRGAEARAPGFRHHRVVHVVVAGDVEERRIQAGDDVLEFVPLVVELGLVFGVALDQVADAHDERRLQEVHLGDGRLEDARTGAAGAVADDDEVEVLRGVVRVEARPGRCRFGRAGVDGDLGSRGFEPEQQQRADGDTACLLDASRCLHDLPTPEKDAAGEEPTTRGREVYTRRLSPVVVEAARST